MISKRRQILFFTLGCALILLFWSCLARDALPALLPGPWRVAQALWALLLDPSFWLETLGPSLWRAISGLLLAVGLGSLLGLVGFRLPAFAATIAPLRVILMGMPAPILAILFILWFEGDSATVILCVAALLLPVFQIAITQGLAAIDAEIDEMVRLFRVPLFKRIRHVTWPALWIALGPAIRIGSANALRVTLLTELLSGTSGLGNAVLTAQSYLLTDRLFALIIVILALIGLLEALLARLAVPGTSS